MQPHMLPPPEHWMTDYDSWFDLPALASDNFRLPPGKLAWARVFPPMKDTDLLDPRLIKLFREDVGRDPPDISSSSAPPAPPPNDPYKDVRAALIEEINSNAATARLTQASGYSRPDDELPVETRLNLQLEFLDALDALD